LLVAQSAPETLHEDLSAEAVADLAEQSSRIGPDKLLSLIEQFADAEGRMKWAANKKMHFEIAAIRAIQTLGQATLTEVLETLTALRGGAPLPTPSTPPKPPARKAEPGSKVGPPAVPEKQPAPKPIESAKPASEKQAAAPVEEKRPTASASRPAVKVNEEPAANSAAEPSSPPSTVSPGTLWPQLIARIRGERPLISEWVESGKLLEVSNGYAVLGFPPEAGLACDGCERANNRTFLEKLLSELAGTPLKLKVQTQIGLVAEKLPREEAKPEPKMDPMEAFKNDPLIQKALAEFRAEILPA